jgi:hypothetical protein
VNERSLYFSGPLMRLLRKLYSCKSRARGFLSNSLKISFFINNRVLGLLVYITLGYRTYMTISFEHLIEF